MHVKSPRRWPSVLLLLLLFSLRVAAGREVPLVQAAKAGDTDAVRALLQQGANVNAAEADGTTALHWAARLNDLESADLLIRSGANANAATTFGVTPQWLAALNGNAPMLRKLLQAGANANAAVGEGETALMAAARSGNVEAVQALLAHGADPNAKFSTGQTALMFAAAEGHPAVIQTLIDGGADVHARTNVDGITTGTAANRARARQTTGGFTSFMFAVRQGHLNAVRALLQSGAHATDTLPDGTGAVVLATSNAHFELALFLVDQGADPNAAANGWTALHELTWVRRPNLGYNPPGPVPTGNLDSLAFVRELVKRGANPNARMTQLPRNGYRTALNKIGATPLLLTALLADAPLMRAFIEVGADPRITNEGGTTVLMAAAGVGLWAPGEDPGTEEEAFECVKFALELGADVNAVDANGDTALHGAAYRGANSVVRLLVDHDANTFTAKNEAGWTPLRIAAGVFRTSTFKEAPETAALLRQLMRERDLPTELEETASDRPIAHQQ